MIITVTLNPSVDRTVEVATLQPGEVMRATGTHVHPGGKGVNVTRALLANGVDSLAVVPVGGADGLRLTGMLARDGVLHREVPVLGHTRSNVTIAEADGTTTKINAPGEALSAAELDAVRDVVEENATAGDWVVLCGSLPPGVDVGVYGAATLRLRRAGMRVAVDTSGPALTAALDAAPDLIKPNAEELSEAVGRPLPTVADAVEAARDLRGSGVGSVVISLGAAGAVMVDGEGVLAGSSTASVVRSSVGAGDCFLAGFLAGQAQGREAALTRALAFGAAAVALPGSGVPGPDQVDLGAAHLHSDIDLPTALAGPTG